MQHVDVGRAGSDLLGHRFGDGSRGGAPADGPPRLAIENAAVGLAAGRAAFGVAMLVLPGLAGRMWLGGGGSRGRRRMMRLLGVRDLVLASGVLLSGRRGPWLAASATADATDALASIAAAVALRRVQPLMVAGLAVAGAVTGAILSVRSATSKAS